MHHIGDDFNHKRNTIIFHNLSDALGKEQSITGSTLSAHKEHNLRLQILLLDNNKNSKLIMSRGIGKNYIEHIAHITGAKTDDIKNRIIICELEKENVVNAISKITLGKKKCTFLPYVYQNLSSQIGKELAQENRKITYIQENEEVIGYMNNKVFMGEIRKGDGMSIKSQVIELTGSKKEVRKNIVKACKLHNTILNNGFILKSSLGLSGIGILVFDNKHITTINNKEHHILEVFDLFLWPRKSEVSKIIIEPRLPIDGENVKSVQLYINDRGKICPYKTTNQIMNLNSNIGNTLSIEIEEKEMSQQLKKVSKIYYKALQDAVIKKTGKYYIGDAAIDIALLNQNHISKEKLIELGINKRHIWSVSNQEGSKFYIYVLENNSRYGGATYISKIEYIFRKQKKIPENVYLNTQSFFLTRTELKKLQNIEAEEYLIEIFRKRGILFNKKTGIGILTSTYMGGDYGKTIITYTDKLDKKFKKHILPILAEIGLLENI